MFNGRFYTNSCNIRLYIIMIGTAPHMQVVIGAVAFFIQKFNCLSVFSVLSTLSCKKIKGYIAHVNFDKDAGMAPILCKMYNLLCFDRD